MPIIREDRQYKIGPIGVARAYEGNLTAQAVARGADQMAGYFFDIAAENAQQKGVELAQSIDRDELLTIDPATGAPAALGRVEDMGRVASQAYTRVLQDRYRQSIEEEIRNQATILAGQYENSGNGVALYQTAMSDYIAEMSNNATGIYRGYIEDFGTSYINSTSASMTVNQLRRSRAEMADAISRSLDEAVASVEGWYAQNGPEAGDVPSLGVDIIDGAIQSVTDGSAAGVLNDNAPSNATRRLNVARASGLIRNFVENNNLSSAEINALNGAIGSQDMAAIRRISPELADQLEPISTDFVAFGALESPANDYLRDRYSVAQYDEAVQTQLAIQRDNQNAFALTSTNSYYGAVNSDTVFDRFNRFGTTGQVAYETTMQSFGSNYSSLNRAIASANDRTRPALEERRATYVESTRDGIMRYLLRDGATDERIEFLQAALGPSGGAVALSRDDAAAIRTLRAMDALADEDVLGDVSTRLGQYKERQSDYFNDEQERQALEIFSETIEPALSNITTSRGATTDQLLEQTIADIRGSGLKDTDLESAIKRANYSAMESRINEFFDYSNLTESQVDAAARYLQGRDVSGEELPLYFRNLLDSATANEVAADSTSALRTEFNTRADQWRSDQVAAQEASDEQRRIYEINNNLGDGSRVEYREAANNNLNIQFQQEFGQAMPDDFFTNPAYASDERFANIFRTAYNTPSVIPESAFTAFRAVASGTFGPNIDASTVLTHWDQMSTYSHGLGRVRASGANALTEAEIAILDYMSSDISITGGDPSNIAQVISAAQAVYRDPNYSENVKAFIGPDYANVESYLTSDVDGYSQLSFEDRKSIRAMFDRIYSVASVQNRGLSSITNELERQINRSFPNGEGIVMGFTPRGELTNHTRYALSAVFQGNEQVFKEHVIAEISELAPSVNARFMPRGFLDNLLSGDLTGGLPDMITRLYQSGPEDIVASRADFVFLAPVGPKINGEVIYGVYQFDPITSSISQVSREDEGNEGLPLMFSSNEIEDGVTRASNRSIVRRNQLVRWAQTGTEYEGLYDMYDGQVSTDLLLQEN